MICTKRRLWAGKIERNLLTVLAAVALSFPFTAWAQAATVDKDPGYNDLQDIVNRGTLRILYQRDQQDGAYRVSPRERVMLEQFARERAVSLEWIPVNARWNLIPNLVDGKGDIIVGQGPALAAGMVDQASFTSPWLAQHPQVVVRSNTTRIQSPKDLAYRQVAIKKSSPAWPVMEKLAEQFPTMELVTIPEDDKIDAIMARVASGQYDVTVADSDFLRFYLPEHPELSVAYDLGSSIVKAWAVQSRSGELLKTLEQFLFKHQMEWSMAEYASHTVSPAANNTGSSNDNIADQSGQLSPYDDLVRKYSDKYGFDWRLIVAQMYQESQFNPGAVSDAGAEGLMQVLPETASSVGIKDLDDPEANIRAGIRYLNLLRNQFESGLLLEDRIWFTLASYNAGPGRVIRARQLAAKMGLDPNLWFGNVETAMLALAAPVEKDGEMVRNCRCGQTVVYVKEIRKLYHNYVRLTQAGQVASISTPYKPYDI